jgi:hypothetical protein
MGEWTRRVKLRQLGLGLVAIGAVLSGVSCADNLAPPPTGSIAITTVTGGPDPDADGYGVTIDEGSPAAIGTNATLGRDNLSPGSHTVELTGIAGNCTVAGDDPRTVTVPTGGTSPVQFTITCVVLPETFTTTTSQDGMLLLLQNQTATETVRIGLETAWGGSIVEVSLNGTNYVNRYDPGREVQPAFYDGNAQYDGCAGCTGVFGWNPVLGGDRYGHGTPILATMLTPTSLYTKAQPIQWYPDDKGGGPAVPVLGDMLVEQTVTPVSGHARAFKVHYKFTHLGGDQHAVTQQELPAVYVNNDYNRFVYYGGAAPWTSGVVSVTRFPLLGQPTPLFNAAEHWGAHVNTQNVGLTVYVPSQYPYAGGFDVDGLPGPTGDATNYFAPFSIMGIGPHLVFEDDVYVIAGDYPTARQIVYDLHQGLSVPDILSPIGSTDDPVPGSTLSGTSEVRGWTFDDVNVARVEILVDGVVAGTASYGSARPDVAGTFPHAPVNIGYSYNLDTTRYVNGPHVVTVRVTDGAGNVAMFPDVRVTVGN